MGSEEVTHLFISLSLYLVLDFHLVFLSTCYELDTILSLLDV